MTTGSFAKGEGKKKKKSAGNKSSRGNKKKHNHLQLVDNDYFSNDDKNFTHLRNQT